VIVLFLGCGPLPATPDGGGDTPFIAIAKDFTGFRSWRSTPGVGPMGAPQPPEAVHGANLTSYLNQAPDSGSTEFPIGTIIVKEGTDGGTDVTGRHAFAMVKRGGGYDTAGAVNWEWFELQAVDDQTSTVVWRGSGPPAAEGYAGTPTACSDCHKGAQSNDYVWTEGFLLTSF
jgi:hypothetical protein